MHTTLADDTFGSLSAEAGTEGWPTWVLFVVAVGISLLLTWVSSELILTEEAYRSVLDERLTASRVEDIYSFNRRFRVLGYIVAPLVVLVRIAFVALLLQMALLLGGIEIRFKGVFRAATIGFFAILYGDVARWLVLWLKDASTLTPADLSYVPGAASNVMDPAAIETPLYQLFSLVNVFELLWCVVVVYQLRKMTKMSIGGTVAATLSVWGMVTLFRWGIALFTMKLGL